MSIYIQKLKWLKQDMIDSYFKSLNDKEQNKEKELKSAITIQKNVRKLLCRKRFILLKEEALQVQKALRGYIARAIYQKDVEEQNDNIMKQFFDYHASIIIKHWKGYRCRKYVMDFHANKKWLAETKKLNEETLISLKEEAQRKQYELNRLKEEQQRKNFVNIAKNLHHLVSTKIIPGVYNTPYLPAELNLRFIMLISKNI